MAKKHHDQHALTFRQALIASLASNGNIYYGVAEQAAKLIKMADQIIEAAEEAKVEGRLVDPQNT